MKTKLIKLSDTHYIVVDDSEIKEGDWFYNSKYQEIGINYNPDGCKKITHSTQPLEQGYGSVIKDGVMLRNIDKELCYDIIKPLSLLEVEELVNGYSVEKMADEYSDFERKSKWGNIVRSAYVKGFKTHQELVKDKFILSKAQLEDMFFEIINEQKQECCVTHTGDSIVRKVIQSLLPKTEWDIEFVDGKMKLI